jgi:hypothetical protein
MLPRVRIEQTFTVASTPESVFDRPNRLRVHVVEGPQPIDGTWVLAAVGAGTLVSFVAEGTLTCWMRFIEPLVTRTSDRQFAKYHQLLKQNVEAAG